MQESPSHIQDERADHAKRRFLKALILFSGVLVLFPLERFSAFLLERKAQTTTYPRTKIANTSDLSPGKSVLFTYPHRDRPAVLIHLGSGDFVAYDAICTHLGCQIHFDEEPIKGWEDRRDNLFCACHGAVFDPTSGAVLDGPPPRAMPKIRLEVEESGDIYANGYASGLPLYGEE